MTIRSGHDADRLIFPRLAGLYAVAAPAADLLLRVVLGVTMVTHGLPKLLGEGHGSMADPMAGSMNLIGNVLGLPGAEFLAGVVTILETFGGAALALGLLTRVVAPMFAVEMAVICLALGPTWPWIDRGIEYPFLLGVLMLRFAFAGGGRASLDRLIGREL
ncbi:DoxX family protein [Inquilinus sp.]|uniref:DoxX family protein n=1 Tax=Inquilinus sp. TaxID=1932117 RepID=UPI003782DAA4